MSKYFICPNCEAEVPLKSLACPECGSDKNTGWSDDTIYDGLGLPEEDTINQQTSTSLFQNKYFISIVTIISIVIFLLMYFL